MATTLSYAVSDFTPFTKIRSADVNSRFTDIKNRLNYDGTSATGLGDDNLQSNTVTGGGLTRATKLKLGTVNAFVSNNASGALSDVTSAANQTLYTDASGIPTAGVLPAAAGGTGQALTPTTAGDVIQVNAAGTAFTLSAVPTPPPVKVFNFYRFS